MSNRTITSILLNPELSFTTSRSSGPGGQNVNKVNSKVTLRFDVSQSEILTQEEKDILLVKLKSKLTTEGVLILTAQDSRSQSQNKEDVIVKLEKFIAKAFEKMKVRKPTKPTKASSKKRIDSKKQLAEKKKWRKKL